MSASKTGYLQMEIQDIMYSQELSGRFTMKEYQTIKSGKLKPTVLLKVLIMQQPDNEWIALMVVLHQLYINWFIMFIMAMVK